VYFQLSFVFQVQYMPNFLCFGNITVITTWRSSLQEGKKISFSLSLLFGAGLCVKTRCCAYVEERWRECVEEEVGMVCMQIPVLNGESRSAVYEGETRDAPIMPKIPEISVGGQRNRKW